MHRGKHVVIKETTEEQGIINEIFWNIGYFIYLLLMC